MLFRYAGATMAKLFGDDAPLVRRDIASQAICGKRHSSQRQHPTALSDNVHTISPIFHHGTALSEILSTIIGGAHRIALLMGKLALDHV
jgi:hypothetical protein